MHSHHLNEVWWIYSHSLSLMVSDDQDKLDSSIFHLNTHKLDSTNFLIWKLQVLSVLRSRRIIAFIDGTSLPPSQTIMDDNGKEVSNPGFDDWYVTDQHVVSYLQSTLTQEAMVVVHRCSTSRDTWLSLEATFNNKSKTREIRLKDDLQCGTSSISDYSRAFKSLCDQLATIGCSVDESKKAHWFLRGLGPCFTTFSTAFMVQPILPSLSELILKAESHDLFHSSILRMILLLQLPFTVTMQVPLIHEMVEIVVVFRADRSLLVVELEGVTMAMAVNTVILIVEALVPTIPDIRFAKLLIMKLVNVVTVMNAPLNLWQIWWNPLMLRAR